MSVRSSWPNCFCLAVALPIVLAATPAPVRAQDQAQQQQQETLTQQQIEQLVAPIALYPDALVAQVLTASTYPLQVAMAAGYMQKNPKLKGAALETAMEKQSWDPSVKGLTSVPQVLSMMNDKLDWTEQLGEAFLAQPDDVQNAIQVLREKAEAAGNLKSSKEQKVRRVAATPSAGYAGPPQVIIIEPVTPDYIYVPVYNPVVVFGIGFWPPAYVPFTWYPTWWAPGPVFGFGPVYVVGPALWCDFRWGYRGFDAIRINTVLYSKFNKVRINGPDKFQNWKFDPNRRGNLAFKNPKLEQQFGKGKLTNKISPDKLITDKGVTGKEGGNKLTTDKLTTDKGQTGKQGGNKGGNKLTTDKLTTDKGQTGKGGNKGSNKLTTDKLTTDKGQTGKQGGNKGGSKITTDKLTTNKGLTGTQGGNKGSGKITTEKPTTNKGSSGPTFKSSGGTGFKGTGGSAGVGSGSKLSGGGNTGFKASGGGGGGGGGKDRKKP